MKGKDGMIVLLIRSHDSLDLETSYFHGMNFPLYFLLPSKLEKNHTLVFLQFDKDIFHIVTNAKGTLDIATNLSYLVRTFHKAYIHIGIVSLLFLYLASSYILR